MQLLYYNWIIINKDAYLRFLRTQIVLKYKIDMIYYFNKQNTKQSKSAKTTYNILY